MIINNESNKKKPKKKPSSSSSGVINTSNSNAPSKVTNKNKDVITDSDLPLSEREKIHQIYLDREAAKKEAQKVAKEPEEAASVAESTIRAQSTTVARSAQDSDSEDTDKDTERKRRRNRSRGKRGFVVSRASGQGISI